MFPKWHRVFLLMSGVYDDYTMRIHPTAKLLQSIHPRAHEKLPVVVIEDGTANYMVARATSLAAHAGGGEHGGGHDFVASFDHRIVGVLPNQFRSGFFKGGSPRCSLPRLASSFAKATED